MMPLPSLLLIFYMQNPDYIITMQSSGEIHPRSKRPTAGKAAILALGKALPRQLVLNEFIADAYCKSTDCHDTEIKQKLARLCKTTMVKTRYVVMSPEVLHLHPELAREGGAPTIEKRLDIAGQALTEMAVEACRACVVSWGRPLSDITHLIYVSSSEARLPGGDLHLARALGLSPSVRRLPLYFLGCSGGVAALRAAKDIAENNPGSRVLLATAETTLIGFRPPSADRSYDLVGAALFGDGAAAAIVAAESDSSPRALFELHETAQRYLPGTEGSIEGRLTGDGIRFRLGKEVPEMVGAEVEGFCEALIGGGERRKEKGFGEMFWAVHPGGPAILRRVEERMGLVGGELGASWSALRDYGNASSNTIFYVLEKVVEESRRRKGEKKEGCEEWGFILAFGPGITFEGILARNMIG